VRRDLTIVRFAVTTGGAIILGGLVSVLILPYMFLLIYTGYAFISSGVATIMYVLIAIQENWYQQSEDTKSSSDSKGGLDK
jgi:hypothetical protein